MKRRQQRQLRTVLVVLVLAVAAYYQLTLPPHSGPLTGHSAPGALDQLGEGAIVSAFREQRSDLWVEAEARIERILRDDNDGSRHQRLIVNLASGHSLLIAHNIDLAPRLPDPAVGETLRFRGEYEWNEQGGVIHWTHHDPQNRHQGGWIEYRGERYQ